MSAGTCKSTVTYLIIFSTINKRFGIEATKLLWIFLLLISKLINLEEKTVNNSLNYSVFKILAFATQSRKIHKKQI